MKAKKAVGGLKGDKVIQIDAATAVLASSITSVSCSQEILADGLLHKTRIPPRTYVYTRDGHGFSVEAKTDEEARAKAMALIGEWQAWAG
jgi:hypothetical protein